MLAPETRDERTGSRPANFLIGIDQHRQRPVLLELHRLQDRDRVQDLCDALLVVLDAESVSTLTIDSERLLGSRATWVDGIHMGEQQDVARARPLEAGQDDPADLRGCVLETDPVCGSRHELHVPAECAQSVGDHLRNAVQSLDVAATRFDRHQLLQRLQIRTAFLLHAGK